MEEIRRFTLNRAAQPSGLDRFLADCLPELTLTGQETDRRRPGAAARGSAKAGEKLKGEALAITLPEAVPAEALPEEIPRILYEDRHLVVIDKPAAWSSTPPPATRGTW
jgi:23S rRNA-/tRNA-specific pseudouridylate synthase